MYDCSNIYIYVVNIILILSLGRSKLIQAKRFNKEIIYSKDVLQVLVKKLCEVKLLPRLLKFQIYLLYLDAVSIHHILCNIMHCLKDLFLYHSIVS